MPELIFKTKAPPTPAPPSSSGKELLTLLAAELDRLEEANGILRTQLSEQGIRSSLASLSPTVRRDLSGDDPLARLSTPDGQRFLEQEFFAVHPLAPASPAWQDMEGRVMPLDEGSKFLEEEFFAVRPQAPASPAWQDMDGHMVALEENSRCHQRRAGNVFEDADDLKRELTETLPKRRSNNIADATARLHWVEPSSLASRLVTSRHFEGVSFLIILLNAGWIAIDADLNHAAIITEAAWYFQVVENMFCIFFLLEWCLWLAAFNKKSVMLLNTWCLFDTVIVLSMVIETWVVPSVVYLLGGSSVLDLDATIFRLLRLTRLVRISRMMRILPEMVFMLKGLAKATRTVSCTVVLLLVVVYTFGVVLRQLSDGTKMGGKYFATVPDAVYTCLLQGTLLDEVREVMDEVREESGLCAIVFGLLIMFSALTMMNMLVGVLCDVIGNVASTEKEQMLVLHVRKQVQSVLDEIDSDNDGKVSKSEFRAILRSPVAVRALQDVGVDVMALVDSAELIFQSDDEGHKFDKCLTFNDFMAVVLQLRGTNAATVRDVMDLRKFVHSQNNAKQAQLVHLEQSLRKLAKNTDKMVQQQRADGGPTTGVTSLVSRAGSAASPRRTHTGSMMYHNLSDPDEL